MQMRVLRQAEAAGDISPSLYNLYKVKDADAYQSRRF